MSTTRVVSRIPLLIVGLYVGACATQSGTTTSPERATTTSSDERAPAASFSTAERERITVVQPWVMQAAQTHALDADLINAVIWVESRFDPKARSPAGARGLMQLMPATASALAQELGWVRPRSTDPEFNVTAGSHYLAKMIDRYDGDERLGLAAYNAGPGNVDKWVKNGGLPPVSERYVELVMDARARFEALQEATADDTLLAEATVTAPASPTPEPPRDLVPEPPAQTPPAHEPEFPVRYDLDRVESTYVPTPPEEPPLVDTPLPREIPARPVTVQPDPDPPATPAGALPSVLD
jgi:hypothetical protein